MLIDFNIGEIDLDYDEMLDRFEGVLLGTAIGDALGAPVEFLKREEILQKYPPRGVFDHYVEMEKSSGKCVGRYTDDTQLTLAITRALIHAGEAGICKLMDEIVFEHLKWEKDETTWFRGPGRTTRYACTLLRKGVHWSMSGMNQSYYCGTSMKTAPIGLYYGDNIMELMAVAKLVSNMTHGHELATAGGIASPLLVSLGLRNIQPIEWLDYLERFLAGISGKFIDYLNNTLRSAIVIDDPYEAVKTAGEGWHAHDAIGVAFVSILKGNGDFYKTMEYAINHDGDSDTTGAIAGALFGSLYGSSKIPQNLKDDLEDSEVIYELSKQLAETTINYTHNPPQPYREY